MKNFWVVDLWDDRNLLELPLKAENAQRSLFIGKLKGGYRTALIAFLNGRKQVIAARLSHKWEVDAYESC